MITRVLKYDIDMFQFGMQQLKSPFHVYQSVESNVEELFKGVDKFFVQHDLRFRDVNLLWGLVVE